MRFSNLALPGALFYAFGFLINVNGQGVCDLCGDSKKTLAIQTCEDFTELKATFETCCKTDDDLSKCDTNRACRYIEFSSVVGCNKPGELQECAGTPAKSFELDLQLDIQNHPAECCAHCNCAGDPHCYDFQRKPNEWIVCDGRDISAGCAITKSVCNSQWDQGKNQCVFDNGKCTPDPKSPKLELLLYQKGDKSVIVYLGVRGIIEELRIKEKKNELILNAVTCKSNPTSPWVGTPVGTMTSSKNGVFWEYNMPGASAGIHITCVHSGTLVKDPHLDVVIVDSSGKKPAGVTGLCSGQDIPKPFSHNNTDTIFETGVCSGKDTNYVAAKKFANGKPVQNDQQVRQVAKAFCYKYIVGKARDNTGSGGGGSKKVLNCFRNIVGKGNRPGWGAAFCAASTLVSKSAQDCSKSIECKTCMTDIIDFGWDYAINKYDKTTKTAPVSGPQCMNIQNLPADLIGCEKGFRIQYLKDGQWITYRAIPYGYTICKTSGKFNSNDNPELFAYPIRIAQCGDLYNSECDNKPTVSCNGEDSVTVTVSAKRIPVVPQFGIVELVNQGILVCKNGKPKDPLSCLSEPFVPCKACKGICPVVTWSPPCTDCAMCPA